MKIRLTYLAESVLAKRGEIPVEDIECTNFATSPERLVLAKKHPYKDDEDMIFRSIQMTEIAQWEVVEP